jgi:CheY-like chemotaxis protein
LTPPYYIMIAEDDHMVRHVLVRTVQLASPVAIPFEVVTLAEALEALRSTKFTAVLTDYYISGGSGLDIVRVARAQDAALPVIVISALAETIEDKALSAGATHVLGKPFNIQQIISILHTIIAQASAT